MNRGAEHTGGDEKSPPGFCRDQRGQDTLKYDHQEVLPGREREVTGGRGRLAGARGFVTSNFLLAASGELIDHQLGLLFLDASRVAKDERKSHDG